MSDMNDCGRSSFASWARGCAHKARWLGQFNPSMTAAEAWKRLDFDGKLSSFASFERGWNSAQADAMLAARKEGGAA